MKAIMIKLLAVAALALLAGCLPAPFNFSDEANRLGTLSMQGIIDEYRRLGSVPGAPGPMPISRGELKAGLMPWQDNPKLSTAQQELSHAYALSAKVFTLDESRPCDTTRDNSTFGVYNDFEVALRNVENQPGGGVGKVYYLDESWIGDGQPAITLDYSRTTPSMGFLHNEIRASDHDNGVVGTATYLGIMWLQIGREKIPFAYFIPDQVHTLDCR